MIAGTRPARWQQKLICLHYLDLISDLASRSQRWCRTAIRGRFFNFKLTEVTRNGGRQRHSLMTLRSRSRPDNIDTEGHTNSMDAGGGFDPQPSSGVQTTPSEKPKHPS